MDGHVADFAVDGAVTYRIGKCRVVVAVFICRRCVFQETGLNVGAQDAYRCRYRCVIALIINKRQLTKQWSLCNQNTRHWVIILVDIVEVIQGKHISRVFRRRHIGNIGDVIANIVRCALIINNLRLRVEARNRDCRCIVNYIGVIISQIAISNLIGNGNLNHIV